LAELVAKLRIFPEQLGARVAAAAGVALLRHLALHLPERLLVFGVHRDEVPGWAIEQRVSREYRLCRVIVDLLRGELQSDPTIYSHRSHSFDVSGPRPESESIQHLLHLLIRRLLTRFARSDYDEGREIAPRGARHRGGARDGREQQQYCRAPGERRHESPSYYGFPDLTLVRPNG
jgi:hypothetical protein